LEITELTLKQEIVSLMNLNCYLACVDGTREFYDYFIHPPGSRIWRYLPLQLQIGAIRLLAGDRCIGMQLTSDESTLDEIRNLLAEEEPTRPLCIPTAGTFNVHGSSLDGYQMIQHELQHVVAFNDRPIKRPREAVYLYDRFMRGLQGLPPTVIGLPFIDECLDWLISGYEDIPTSLDIIEKRLRESEGAREIESKIVENLINGFRTSCEGELAAEQSLCRP